MLSTKRYYFTTVFSFTVFNMNCFGVPGCELKYVIEVIEPLTLIIIIKQVNFSCESRFHVFLQELKCLP